MLRLALSGCVPVGVRESFGKCAREQGGEGVENGLGEKGATNPP